KAIDGSFLDPAFFTFLEQQQPRRSEEHTSELQSLTNLVCRLLLEKKFNLLDKAHPELEAELQLPSTHEPPPGANAIRAAHPVCVPHRRRGQINVDVLFFYKSRAPQDLPLSPPHAVLRL